MTTAIMKTAASSMRLENGTMYPVIRKNFMCAKNLCLPEKSWAKKIEGEGNHLLWNPNYSGLLE